MEAASQMSEASRLLARAAFEHRIGRGRRRTRGGGPKAPREGDHVKRAHSAGLVALSVILLVACGSSGSPSTPSPTPTEFNVPSAQGTTGKVIGEVTVPALPQGTLAVDYVEVAQPANSTVPHEPVPGFMYNADGTHRITMAGGQPKDISPGEGAFLEGDASQSHINPASGINRWYFVAVRSGAQRTPSSYPGAKVLYATLDLPVFGAGRYVETLRLTTIAPGGRTASHQHGGVEVFIILKGSARVRVGGAAPATLQPGQGIRILPGTPLQVFNVGSDDAVLLVFLATLEGVPFQTNLNASP
jgi:quercetin dioxygenase-like cupin family protein